MTATDFLLWLQELRNPVFTGFFYLMTFIGSEEFLLLFLAVVYWCVNRTLGLRLALVMLASQFLNETLKDATNVPRPGAPIVPLYPDTTLNTSAWPSGHAQNTAALWGTLAGLVRRSWVMALAGAVILLVGVSRLYLGLHWPIDVLSGWLLGGLAAAIALALVARFPRVTVALVPPPWLLAGLALPLVLLALHPTNTTAKAAGAVLGLIAGWWLERRLVGFEAPAPLLTQVIKAVIGLVVAFGLRVVLKEVFAVLPWEIGADLLRYVILGLWITWLAPALFVRLFGRAPAGATATAPG
jgi:membrane-associated phospholipid phosphatase